MLPVRRRHGFCHMSKSKFSYESVSPGLEALECWEQEFDRRRASRRVISNDKVTVKWFLSFCRKQDPPLWPGRSSGNAFYRQMVAEHDAAPWQKQQWKSALAAFLDIVEPEQTVEPARSGVTGDDVDESGVWAGETWGEAFVRVVRCRHLSYRTERTYLGWVKRFESWLDGRDVCEAADSDVERFLSDLAVKEAVSAGTQNQAFNALLFLFRHVLRRENIQWSGVKRATTRRRVPVVLRRDEVGRLLA